MPMLKFSGYMKDYSFASPFFPESPCLILRKKLKGREFVVRLLLGQTDCRRDGSGLASETGAPAMCHVFQQQKNTHGNNP